MVIQHCIEAMNANGQLKKTTNSLRKSSMKLSSGYKINSAADDAAGLAISERMRKQIRGLYQGADNIQEGVGYCQTADGALEEIQEMLQRVNELAIQAANGTNSADDRAYINDEIIALKNEMQRVCDTTKFNEEYIFKTDSGENYVEPYEMTISGNPNDLYIYNESYDATTGTATYGGIAYRGKRYSWDSIDSNMYDSANGVFNAGTYTLKADDGSTLQLVCEDGSEPPQVSREFEIYAGNSGIYVNGDLIKWDDVKTESGESFDPDDYYDDTYYFEYNGVTASFTPDSYDDFYDTIERLSTKWRSDYKLPYEDTALFANFSTAKGNFASNTQVKDYLDGNTSLYTVKASDDGIWLVDSGNNEVSGSRKTWADLGITNWGDQSTDIWSDKLYKYIYSLGSALGTRDALEFEFSVVNEVSKDSVIAALDGVGISYAPNSVAVSNHENLTFDNSNNTNVISGKLTYDSTELSLGEEYGLGRDYSTISDTFSENTALVYDDTDKVFKTVHAGTTTTKTYSNTDTQTQNIIDSIKKQVSSDLGTYIKVVNARIKGGATDPTNTNLATLVGNGNMTGDGSDTYLSEVFTFDPTDTTLKSTLSINQTTSYAGASIDFSGLGTSYNLADLIGMGFNSTCETCSRHYSVEFTTPDVTNTTWSTANIDGQAYKYSYQQQGNNYTLYIDLDSMKDNGIAVGDTFTNVLVGILDASKYDFHFTQYATKEGESKLYVFDNRSNYAQNGTSTATDASFSPYSYNFENMANITLNLYDTDDQTKSMTLSYTYDYSDIFDASNIKYEYSVDPNGDYVLDGSDYVKYDSTNPNHANLDRYSFTGVKFEDANGNDLDAYLDDYIVNTMFNDIASSSKLSITSDYAKFGITGNANDSKAMITEYDTPYQIIEPEEMSSYSNGTLRIQCSSTVKDCINIKRQKLSVDRMGLKRLNVETVRSATAAAGKAGEALRRVSKIRSTFGAYQNRLEHAYKINQNTAENTQSAESIIRDTDMAKEMVNYSKASIIAQAGQSMLAQANQINNDVLSLIG